VLLYSMAGMCINFLSTAWAPNLACLFIGRVIGGMSSASMSVASAYASDVSTPENRAKSFGKIGAAFGLGFVCGPMLGGLLGNVSCTCPSMWPRAVGRQLRVRLSRCRSRCRRPAQPFAWPHQSLRRPGAAGAPARDPRPGGRLHAGHLRPDDAAIDLGAVHHLPLQLDAARQRHRLFCVGVAASWCRPACWRC
jgi:hypothetical protein